MNLLEQAINWLQHLSPIGVLFFLFFFCYLENVFPPSPSDSLVVFAGTLIGLGTIGFVPALIAATLGSTAGFATCYVLGRYFENHVVSGKFGNLISADSIHKVENLFKKYGYGVIIVNRFLAGIRGLISFFAGMSKMNFAVTTALSALSAAVWNFILLYLGKIFAANWRQVTDYMAIYGKIVTVIIIVAIIIGLFIYYRRRKTLST